MDLKHDVQSFFRTQHTDIELSESVIICSHCKRSIERKLLALTPAAKVEAARVLSRAVPATPVTPAARHRPIILSPSVNSLKRAINEVKKNNSGTQFLNSPGGVCKRLKPDLTQDAVLRSAPVMSVSPADQ